MGRLICIGWPDITQPSTIHDCEKHGGKEGKYPTIGKDTGQGFFDGLSDFSATLKED
jgi:hypothetical protein